MRKNSKQHIVAKSHENPEYAAMSARKLSSIIGVSQPVISAWRRRVKRAASFCAQLQTKERKLKPKVTVSSVRRKWEEKYAHLNRQYEALADRLIDMAKHADKHRNEQKRLEKELASYKESHKVLDELLSEKNFYIAKMESRSWIQRLFNSKA